jgi:hypothetical protein
MKTERQAEAQRVFNECGRNYTEAARRMDTCRKTVQELVAKAEKWDSLDPAFGAAMRHINTNTVPHGMWVKTKPTEDAPGYSVYLRPEQSQEDFISQIGKAIDLLDVPASFPARPKAQGDNLLIIDPADLHVQKLCVKSETGYEYNHHIAVHRLVEGTKALLENAKPHGIGRILFIAGNDAFHTDTAKKTTTSGTLQDTSGSVFEAYPVAVAGFNKSIELCLDVAPVDMLFCPSNHDWLLGWTMAREIAAHFRNEPNFRATEYNMSERHRKYYRYGGGLFGFSHADGAKERDLGHLMVVEARQHISECRHRYWYLHHFHHKIRKADGVLPMNREKDHIGFTAINVHNIAQPGDNVEIEYVRSPSPPDGWHDRNGYVNLQAVECFIHKPDGGQKARFTEWF